jgi:hypothetical protein
MKGKTIMHPSQMSSFRKTIIALITIAFAGTLLVFTANANLDLLKSIYPNPQFYMFGLLALEGGTVYWTGYYLLHLSGVHKGLAVFSLAIDAALSGTGFFYEMERTTSSVGTISLPPVIAIVGFAVVFNVAMAIISHLIPSGAGSSGPRPKEEPLSYVREERPTRQLEQRSRESDGPGLLKSAAANVVAAGQDIMELAREKRQARKEAQEEAVSLSHDDESEDEPSDEQPRGLKRPLPKSSASQQSDEPSDPS